MSYFNYEISLSGLYSGLKALKVTQNNIANIGTDGYARQRLELEEGYNGQLDGIDAQIGSGVFVDKVSRITDEYLIQQSRDHQSKLNYFDGLKSSLSSVEKIFNETNAGSLSNLIEKFFNSWEEASKFTEQSSYRQAVLGIGATLADRFQVAGDQLNKIKAQTDDRIEEKVNKINQLLKNIADINKKISLTSTDNPNTLLDNRDRYMDELSKLVDIKVELNSKKLTDIRINGVLVVSGHTFNPVATMKNSATNNIMLTANGVEIKPSSGALLSEIDLRNQYIVQYENELNSFASTFITKINSYHTTGFGLDNSTGNDFFTGTSAYDIQVNASIKNNPEKLALSSSSLADTPGNSDVGKLIAGVRDEKVFSGGTTSLIEYYTKFVTKMGTDLNVAKDNVDLHSNVLQGVIEQRQNVQGVNMDEEMSNLLKYQRFYTANAKTLKTMNDLMDSLFGMLG